jgi:hypothetical protein
MPDSAYRAVLTGLLALATSQTDEEAGAIIGRMKPFALSLSRTEFDACQDEASRLLLKHLELIMGANTNVLLNLDKIMLTALGRMQGANSGS